MNTQDDLLTTAEVATRFRVNSSQVRRWVKSGLLQPAIITPGRHYRFTEDSLRVFTPPYRIVDQHTGVIAPLPGQLTIDGKEIVTDTEEREA